MLKVVSKRLETTRSKISRSWQGYRTEKKYVLGLKSISSEEKRQRLFYERQKILDRTSDYFKDYRGFKHSRLFVSDQPDFNFTKKLGTTNTAQKFYTAKRSFDTDKLDKIVPGLLDKSKVKGVMIIQDVYNKELQHKTTVSKYITKANLHKAKGNIYDYMNENIFGLLKYEGYKMKNIQMRVIYEK